MIHSLENNYKLIIEDCFKTDQELLNKWHIESGNGLENCVIRTYNDLINANVKVYSLKENNNLIGFFGIEESTYLSGFFIKPEYRKKEYITQFWNIVNKEFNNKKFYSGIYKKNNKAYNFLLKNNGKIAFELPDAVFFVFNGEF